MEDEDEATSGYKWTRDYERSWANLEEDETGVLKTSTGKRRKTQHTTDELSAVAVRRGLIRYLFLLLDLSVSMNETDMRPCRIDVTLNVVREFIKTFFDENPLSQLGILVTKNGIAFKLTELSGSQKVHLKALDKLETNGEASYSNLLKLTYSKLSAIPLYGNREALLITSALSSCDPDNIEVAINNMKSGNIRCSVVSLSAEMYVCKLLTKVTGGTFRVALNPNHLKELVLEHIRPPACLASASQSSRCSFVQMGFPSQTPYSSNASFVSRTKNMLNKPVICADSKEISTNGYYCPRCHTVCSELPATCKVCRLQLIAAPHLQRSYHHLFPVPLFKEVHHKVDSTAVQNGEMICSGCSRNIAAIQSKFVLAKQLSVFQCPECKNSFCSDCDMYIHDKLHNCPTCLFK